MSHPFDFFPYEKDEMRAGSARIRELADKYGTPLYVYSAEAFLAPLRELQRELKAIDPLVCFAVKSCPNIHILRLLAEAGAGMDLVSGGELERALRAGADPKRVVFSGVGKSAAEMDLGLKYPLHSFNVESVEELRLLDARAKLAMAKPSVALRFNPDVNPKTHPYISTGLKKNKFGLNRKEILAIAARYADFPHLHVRGLSVHIGSQIQRLQPFEESFRKVRDLADALSGILPVPIEFIDLGGGLGIGYGTEKTPQLKDYAKTILKVFGPKAKLKYPYRVGLEPGRTISGNAGILVSRVLYRKRRDRKDFLIIDAGMNDLLRPALYGSAHAIAPVAKKLAKGARRKTDIVGPVCESSDCFASDVAFPAAVDAGDLVALMSAGAYGMSMSSNYNTRNRPAEVLVERGGDRLIRRRETFADQIRAEELPERKD